MSNVQLTMLAVRRRFKSQGVVCCIEELAGKDVLSARDEVSEHTGDGLARVTQGRVIVCCIKGSEVYLVDVDDALVVHVELEMIAH